MNVTDERLARSVYGSKHRRVLARVAEPLAGRARERRHSVFHATIAPQAGETILDIGCGNAGLARLEPGADITGLDALDRPNYPGRRFVHGDARSLPFEDGSFAIAYSNSLVEHLDPSDRARFAAEVRRVAQRYWVQTPNRWFPVEPHVLLPGFQFLPEGAKRRLWSLGRSSDYERIELLDVAELRALFPDAIILRERFAGLTKSLIAVGPTSLVRPAG